jgi:hypothetical protein
MRGIAVKDAQLGSTNLVLYMALGKDNAQAHVAVFHARLGNTAAQPQSQNATIVLVATALPQRGAKRAKYVQWENTRKTRLPLPVPAQIAHRGNTHLRRAKRLVPLVQLATTKTRSALLRVLAAQSGA